jgi:PKD repeat protein
MTSGNTPLKVLFNDTSTDIKPTTWLWDFGDGITSKHAMNATHTFKKPGSYTVSLTVRNDEGSNTLIKLNHIAVTDPFTTNPMFPVANFSSKVTKGYYSFVVQFYDLSQNAVSRVWDFDNDGYPDSYDQNPSYICGPGTHIVKLIVANEIGTSSKLISIHVGEEENRSNWLPDTNFSSNETSGNAPLTVQFIDLSSGATGWNWNFGDGATSKEQNPMHTYSIAGNYTVTLTVIIRLVVI